MSSYLRIALDFLRFSGETDRALFSAAATMPLIAARAVERVGGRGSLYDFLGEAEKETVAEVAVFHRRVAETLMDGAPTEEDALLAGHNAMIAVICFGNAGVYTSGSVQHRLFEQCSHRYARYQALADALD